MTDTAANFPNDASSPAQIPAPGWWQVLKRTYAESGRDNVSVIAAGVAFYAFLAFVPLLGSLVLIYGLVAEPSSVVQHMQAMTAMMPADAAKIIGEQMMTVTETASSKKGFGLLLAILGISVMGFVEDLLPFSSPFVHILLKILFWIVAAASISFLVALIYRYAPNRPTAKWQWISPGSIIATLLWVVATVGFGFYVSSFGSYNATYGSLGAVVVFLTWLYLTAYILLMGGELNSELEKQTTARTTKS